MKSSITTVLLATLLMHSSAFAADTGMQMREHLQGMESRMEMMQKMMSQMMEHDGEESARPIHQHKR